MIFIDEFRKIWDETFTPQETAAMATKTEPVENYEPVPPAAPIAGPWIRTSDRPPPIGIMVQWFVRGKVRVGMQIYDARGALARMYYMNLPEIAALNGANPGLTELKEFTHWMPLASGPSLP